MGLDRVLAVWLVVAVLVAEALSPVRGPLWPAALALGCAGAWLWATRRRPGSAPDPISPRPAVLIPVHNNAATVGEVAHAALQHRLPVYVVDDGSTDGSGDRARAAGATVVVHPRNRGKGAALATGMQAIAEAGYTHAICLDADGQHDPADIPRFAAAIAAEPVAVFAGVRDLSTAPESSRFGRRFSNFWIWIETGWRVADSQCGFRAYPLAPVLALGLQPGRYEWEVAVLTRLLWDGVPVRDLDCRVYYPPPEERVSSFRMFRDNARISWMNTGLVAERLLWPPRWAPVRPGPGTWTGASRGTALGWRLVLGVMALLGRRPAYALIGFLASWFMMVAPTARRAVASAIARAAPARAGLAATWSNFYHFGQAIADRFVFLRRGPRAFTYTHEGLEHIQEAFGAGGVVLLGAHVGNIEVASGPSSASERHRGVHVVRFDAPGDHGRALIEAMPPEWRPTIITVNRDEGFSALSIVRALREGAVVVMLGDRYIDARVLGVELLGAPCRVPAGPWVLAAIARAPIYPFGCFKEGGTSYRVVCGPPLRIAAGRGAEREAAMQRAAQAWADQISAWVRRYPTQYFNFYDIWAASAAPSAAAGPTEASAARASTSART